MKTKIYNKIKKKKDVQTKNQMIKVSAPVQLQDKKKKNENAKREEMQ